MQHLFVNKKWWNLRKIPQSQKNRSIINLEREQVKVMALFVNYRSLEQNQPAPSEAPYAQKH